MRYDSQEHNRFVLPPGIRHKDSSAALLTLPKTPQAFGHLFPFASAALLPHSQVSLSLGRVQTFHFGILKQISHL